MYFYSLGYGDYNGSEDIILWHSENYSQQEFEDFILRAVHFIIDDIKKDIEKNDSTLNIKYINYLGQQKKCYFYDIFYTIADLMCEKFGFKMLEFDGFVSVNANNNFFDKKSQSTGDPLYNKISDIMIDSFQKNIKKEII